jgi:hypothetical protein
MAKAHSLGYTTVYEPNYGAAARHLSVPLRGRKKFHLVLFCIPKSLVDPEARLKQLRYFRRRIIVYAHTAQASADNAVQYCHDGLADGYLVQGDAASEHSVEEMVRKLHRRIRLYSIKFNWLSAGKRPAAFISTPFDKGNLLVMKTAVELALTKLRFRVKWGNEIRSETLHDEIKRGIRRSSLVVANINLDPRNHPHNPNVYFEVGLAKGFGRTVVLVRHASEEGRPLPADIHGCHWHSYDNEIDLALKLYHGLQR